MLNAVTNREPVHHHTGAINKLAPISPGRLHLRPPVQVYAAADLHTARLSNGTLGSTAAEHTRDLNLQTLHHSLLRLSVLINERLWAPRSQGECSVRNRHLITSSLVAVFAGCAAPALSQDVDAPDSDIIVTAARSTLPPNALPLTVDAIGKDTLDQQMALSGSVTDAVLPSSATTAISA
jgi:hypothetical protein